MLTTQTILLIVITFLGIPTGFFLKHLTKEELKDGRKWFLALAILSLLSMFLSLFLAQESLALILTVSGFIFFISVIPLFGKVK